MSALLTLPIELDVEELIPYDEVVIYRREDAYFISELATVPLGTASFSVADGRVDDEYHIRFREAATGVLSLPSGICRILEPWKQRGQVGVVVVTFELDTTGPIPSVDFVAIYRRKPDEDVATRIALVALGTARYQDPDGLPGDIYHSTFVDTANSAESQPSAYFTANAGSGLVVVSGRFEDLTGLAAETFNLISSPTRARDIQITLIKPEESVNSSLSARGQTIAIDYVEAFLDDQGKWSISLIPNNLITPSRTYYMFQYRGTRFFKRIDSQYGAVQNFSLLPDAEPHRSGQRLLGRNF